ncbi:LRR receptor-like serine/threonine-protein kinase GSO2 [Acorus calamus]|uniref:LRR receptor-like serine/threonine-protein kinase GSO2 n=1 Tax=Acorus calamus TaxID=4465 RepID=A0AAV9CJL3_ACOCL|nr:LRR receptor-like serine/threonine-protein kinase GSO2 [Acorus calamus]
MAAIFVVVFIASLSLPTHLHAQDSLPPVLADKIGLEFFRTGLNPTKSDDILPSWVPPKASPCRDYAGIVCDHDGIVTGIHLSNADLAGYINVPFALSHLSRLDTLDVSRNRIAGPIPDFSPILTLQVLNLSYNGFSGSIPDDYFSGVKGLKVIWLAYNGFTGEIPSSLSELDGLTELRLEGNKFSGKIPASIASPTLKSFNVSHNSLTGEVPEGLERFKASAFEGNDGLSGEFGKTGKAVEAAVVEEEEKKKKKKEEEEGEMDEGSWGLPVALGVGVIVVGLVALLVIVRRIKAARSFNSLNSENHQEGTGSADVRHQNNAYV